MKIIQGVLTLLVVGRAAAADGDAPSRLRIPGHSSQHTATALSDELLSEVAKFALDEEAASGVLRNGYGGTAMSDELDDCVPVNHQYDHPGEVTCDCVSSDDPCLTDIGEHGPHCIPDESCEEPDEPDDCVPVNHQYDHPGEVTCDCVSFNDPCLTDMGEHGPHCIPDESCEEPDDCVPVNHQYDHPGEVTCDCVSFDDPCLTDMGEHGPHCIPDESCEEPDEPDDCVPVNHQYDHPGEVTCDCVSSNNPCLTDMWYHGPHCIFDKSCADEPYEPDDCVPVNHQYDHPGEVTCDCVSSDNPCLTDMGKNGPHCIFNESCKGYHDEPDEPTPTSKPTNRPTPRPKRLECRWTGCTKGGCNSGEQEVESKKCGWGWRGGNKEKCCKWVATD